MFKEKINKFILTLKKEYNSRFMLVEEDGLYKIMMNNRDLFDDSEFTRNLIDRLVEEFGDAAIDILPVYDFFGKMVKDKSYETVTLYSFIKEPKIDFTDNKSVFINKKRE